VHPDLQSGSHLPLASLGWDSSREVSQSAWSPLAASLAGSLGFGAACVYTQWGFYVLVQLLLQSLQVSLCFRHFLFPQAMLVFWFRVDATEYKFASLTGRSSFSGILTLLMGSS